MKVSFRIFQRYSNICTSFLGLFLGILVSQSGASLQAVSNVVYIFLFILKVSNRILIKVTHATINKVLLLWFLHGIRRMVRLRIGDMSHNYFVVRISWRLWSLATFTLIINISNHPFIGILNTLQALFFHFIHSWSIFIKLSCTTLPKELNLFSKEVRSVLTLVIWLIMASTVEVMVSIIFIKKLSRDVSVFLLSLESSFFMV